MLNPRMALTSTGCAPRVAGRNFQLGKAAIILAVMAAGPGSRTCRSFRLPEESSLHLITTRARGRFAGKLVRMPWGPVSAPRPCSGISKAARAEMLSQGVWVIGQVRVVDEALVVRCLAGARGGVPQPYFDSTDKLKILPQPYGEVQETSPPW
jgi:hypothetical protein